MVLRTIKVLAEDGQTEIASVNVQDGGMAAEVVIPQDWRTAAELRDIATACTRMAEVLEAYQATGDPAGLSEGGE